VDRGLEIEPARFSAFQRRCILFAIIVWVVLSGGYVLQQAANNPLYRSPTMDSAYHDSWAKDIASGRLTFDQPFYRAPLYPYFLCFSFAAAGTNTLVPRLVQVLFGVSLVVFVGDIARRVISPAAGVWAAFLAAICWPFHYFSGEFLVEALALPFVALGMWFVVRTRVRLSATRWLICGLI
jgi:4-amino-4-deoxy-L-arabinose transferase-like glycosyltransferase